MSQHTDEICALLALCGEDQFNSGPNHLLKLLNIWLARVPVAQRGPAFEQVPQKVWENLGYPYYAWAVEQKAQHPSEIVCSMEQLWPANAAIPPDCERAVLLRLGHWLDLPKNKNNAERFSDFASEAKNQGVFKSIVGKPDLNAQLKKLCEQFYQDAPALYPLLTQCLPPSFVKILLVNNQQASIQEQIKKQLQHTQTPQGLIAIITRLGVLDPRTVAVDKLLQQRISIHFKDHKFSVFQKCCSSLSEQGWSASAIKTIAPLLSNASFDLPFFYEFLPYLIKEQPKRVQLFLTEALEHVISNPLKSFSKVQKICTALQRAGVSQNTLDQWFSNTQLDCGVVYDAIVQSIRPTVALKICQHLSSTNGITSVQSLAPQQFLGTMNVIFHLCGGPLDTRFPAFATSDWKKLDLYEEPDGKTRVAMEQYTATVQSVNIHSKISEGTGFKKSRKM